RRGRGIGAGCRRGLGRRSGGACMSASVLLRVAWQALRLNAARSLLTMLGIIIGVGAVIASMAIGEGAQAVVLAQIESLGANLIVVIPGAITSGGVRLGNISQTTLRVGDAIAIAQRVPGVVAAEPDAQTNAQLVAGGANWFTYIGGTTPAWQIARSWRVAEGRFFTPTEVDEAAKVTVLGHTVAQTLFPTGGAVGATVIIKNVPFRVVGILLAKGSSGGSSDQDDTAVVPITTLQHRMTGIPWLRSIFISAATPDKVPEVIDATKRLLRLRHHLTVRQPDDFSVRNYSDVQQVRLATAQTQALLLAGIAVVSLVVGGIGMMNIMLVSVTERTREIGLRMAVGARSEDVLFQFLIEAVLLSFAGGFIGMLLGIGLSRFLSHTQGWSACVARSSLRLSFF